MLEAFRHVRLSTNARRAIGILLVAVTVCWILWAFPYSLEAFSDSLKNVRLSLMITGMILSLLGTLIGFLAFRILFNAASPHPIKLSVLGHLYFSAQLLKHLPGRFIGVGYQIVQTRGTVSMGTWISVTVLYMAMILGTSLGVAGSILFAERDLLLALATCFILLVVMIVPAPHAAVRLLEVFDSRYPKLGGFVSSLVGGLVATSLTARLGSVAILLISWTMYILSWVCYAAAHPALEAGDGVTLSALYMISWALGFLALVIPSGLGVREMSLAALMHSYPPAVMLYAIIVGRISLTLVDIVLAAVFAPFAPRSRPDD